MRGCVNARTVGWPTGCHLPSRCRTDRITKLREYGVTPSIQCHVILRLEATAAMVVARKGLLAEALTAADILRRPGIAIEILRAECHAGIELGDDVERDRVG